MKYLITILLLVANYFAIASELYDIKKIDDNKVLLRFNDRVNYSTALSEDKKNIFLIVSNTSNKLKVNSKRISSDIVKEVFVQNKSNGLLLNIILNSPSGYNTYQLPYSNSIVIDVFDWKTVDKIEDKYRSGLFAFESSLYKQATLLFEDTKSEIKEANALLGIIYLLEDSLEKSFVNLIRSAQNNTYVPDVYAALSQIYKEKGDYSKAKYYEDKFYFKLGLADTIISYPKLIFDKSKIDSLKVDEIIDTSAANVETNSDNKRFSHLFDENSSDETSNTGTRKMLENDDAFLEMKGWLKYLIIFFLLSGLFVFSLYLKWRKTKLENNNQIAKKSFEQELREENKRRKEVPQSVVFDRLDDVYIKPNKTKNDEPPIQKSATESYYNEGKNVSLDNINLKIEANNILKNIEKPEKIDSNTNIPTSSLDNNELKSKLYAKFNVHNDRNKDK